MRVSMLSALMLIWTADLRASVPSTTAVPSRSLNAPRIFVTSCTVT